MPTLDWLNRAEALTSSDKVPYRVLEPISEFSSPRPLAELSTRQIAESMEATSMGENESAAKTGGGIAKKARLELEGKTGKKVVSATNYLPLSQKKIK